MLKSASEHKGKDLDFYSYFLEVVATQRNPTLYLIGLKGMFKFLAWRVTHNERV
jgi:hypothetical protein